MVVAQGYLGDFDGGDAVQEPASQVHLGAHVARPIHVHIHRLAMRSYDNNTPAVSNTSFGGRLNPSIFLRYLHRFFFTPVGIEPLTLSLCHCPVLPVG